MQVRRKAQRAHVRPVVGLARFEPATPVATAKVQELLSRGATLANVTRALVTLKRLGQTATVDNLGRVQWVAPGD